jgi:site-specific DNA recombinase
VATAVYLRVSTEEQRERQSIATQREFGERYCQLHDLAVYRVYADDGVSGTVPLELRPEGSQILKDARLGKFDRLLVYKLDRLGRETRLILNGVAELEKVGVRVRSMTEEFDTGTPTGRLMLTLLSGFASHERDMIRERCVAGTLRVAEAGVWLGGIVPFGYRKVGETRHAHLVISEDPIAGLVMSEADVIRAVFRMAAVERKSCRVVADKLNQLRIPCAYVRDDRLTLRGKRKQRTSGIWRAGRIRGLITNKTYMGIHEFGKRSVSGRPLILRQVTAIVSEEVWLKAQANLRSHLLFSPRNAKNQYLLRGLIKCGICGLTYIGVAAKRPNGRVEFYYRCNGAHSPSVYSKLGRCQSKALRGDLLEQQVWSEVETFLRNPEPVLQQLQTRLESDSQGADHIRRQVLQLEGLLTQKATERSRMVGLYRRGRLAEADLDAQMDEIGKEEKGLEAQVIELRGKIAGADSIGATISSAQVLLEKLRKRLDEPICWDLKRRIIEVLVAGGRVETVECWGVKQCNVTVTYRFSPHDQPIPLDLPQLYSGSAIGMPTELRSVGDHLRRGRLVRKMLQKQVAEQIGVDKTSIHNWETGVTGPGFEYMPAIIRFLGYNPLPEGQGWGERLVRQRTTLGLSQKASAQCLGLDPSTLAKWERGEREPTGALLSRVKRFLDRDEGTTATGPQLETLQLTTP